MRNRPNICYGNYVIERGRNPLSSFLEDTKKLISSFLSKLLILLQSSEFKVLVDSEEIEYESNRVIVRGHETRND